MACPSPLGSGVGERLKSREGRAVPEVTPWMDEEDRK
jgi:hypothetical protein